MSRPPNPTAIHQMELQALRVLCSVALLPAARSRAVRDLDSHSWNAPEHRIVFDAIRKLAPYGGESLREMLPAQGTRMGFPDVNWDVYFTVEKADENEIRALVNKLKATEIHRD